MSFGEIVFGQEAWKGIMKPFVILLFNHQLDKIILDRLDGYWQNVEYFPFYSFLCLSSKLECLTPTGNGTALKMYAVVGIPTFPLS